jgi:hypothetical protein
MELFDLVKQDVIQVIMERLAASGRWDHYLQDLVQKKTDPYTISEEIVARYLREEPQGPI